jgi:hypothetical protein
VRSGADDVFAWGKDTLSKIRGSPIARSKGYAARIHGPDGQHRWYSRRYVDAVAAVVSRGRNDQHVVLGATANRSREIGLSFSACGELACADADNMRTRFNRLKDGASHIQLRAGSNCSVRPVGEHRYDQPAATRSNAGDGSAMPAEYNACDVGTVPRRSPGSGLGGDQSFEDFEPCLRETVVGDVNGTVEDGDADSGIAGSFRPQPIQTREVNAREAQPCDSPRRVNQ